MNPIIYNSYPTFDTVDLGISEVDGTQTQFLRVRNEPTLVTLCFKRRGKS